ncbi:MarR family winged helix-turn-helix transcriptional regulator [Sphingobium aromaticiconvertens]|uniref:MarR family winged helix-turn-helix transcriptional regulator n=1 Tax=Sphingobium aromaticiconvertens TaxID=365341 RepID=UPI00301AB3FD
MVDDGNYHGLCPPAMVDVVSALRAFNRFHTRFTGVLQPSYMDSGLGLTAARLLYEIARGPEQVAGQGILARTLQERLGIDAGFASRLLRDFERRGWIERRKGADGRQRPIHLTDDGRAFFDRLEEKTRAHAEGRITHLDDVQRAALIAALGEVRRLLGDVEA